MSSILWIPLPSVLLTFMENVFLTHHSGQLLAPDAHVNVYDCNRTRSVDVWEVHCLHPILQLELHSADHFSQSPQASVQGAHQLSSEQTHVMTSLLSKVHESDDNNDPSSNGRALPENN